MSRPIVLPSFATNSTYPAGGSAWSSQPPRVAPSAGVLAQGFTPQTDLPAEYMNYLLGTDGDWINYLDALQGISCFGDGSDGPWTASGTTQNWGSFAGTGYGSAFVLTRDVYFTNMTVPTGLIVDCGSFRIFVQNTLTIQGTGSITANGYNAQNSTGGGAVSAGTIIGRAAGATSVSTTGVAGTAVTNSFGGNSGASGTGSSHTGIAASLAAGPSPSLGGLGTYSEMTFGSLIGGGSTALIAGGAGGPSSGGGTGATGVGGGGGAGVLCIAARIVVLATASGLQARGGAGGDATQIVGTNCGGGAGGGGGVVFLIYGLLTITDASTLSASVNCTGGLFGPATGTGVAGGPGIAGKLVTRALR